MAAERMMAKVTTGSIMIEQTGGTATFSSCQKSNGNAIGLFRLDEVNRVESILVDLADVHVGKFGGDRVERPGPDERRLAGSRHLVGGNDRRQPRMQALHSFRDLRLGRQPAIVRGG